MYTIGVNSRVSRVACAAVVVGIVCAGPVQADDAEPRGISTQLAADFRYSVNSLEADGEDLLFSPLHAGDPLQKREFYLGALGVGLALGEGLALDRPAHDHTEHMSHGLASGLETSGQIALWGATSALYAYGLYKDDSRAREVMLTTLESAGLSALVSSGLKRVVGRERPRQSNSPLEFFQGGHSFPSSATTPAFALAAGISEYGDYRWQFAVPAYTAAAAVGLGRMGRGAHWLSDVLGSALLGVGTTELMLHLHGEHAKDPSRYRVFPVAAGGSLGVGVAFEW